MERPAASPALAQARTDFDELVRDVRVELHRYCARMTGSVVDGEDVLQDALAKAFYMLPIVGDTPHLRPWLFRIAHNKCLDFLRRYDRRYGEPLDEHPALTDESDALESREMAELALPHYLKLTALQRSCVILKDVVGYSLAELSELLDVSIPAIKGALHRGRAALREGAGEQAAVAGAALLDAEEARLLDTYAAHFNNRNFDALRDMLAEDAKLELVGRHSARGRASVGNYYGNYERLTGWRVRVGSVDGQPALLGFDPLSDAAGENGRPGFFILVQFREGRVRSIRDYRYARHTAELALFADSGTAPAN